MIKIIIKITFYIVKKKLISILTIVEVGNTSANLILDAQQQQTQKAQANTEMLLVVWTKAELQHRKTFQETLKTDEHVFRLCLECVALPWATVHFTFAVPNSTEDHFYVNLFKATRAGRGTETGQKGWITTAGVSQ